jgi:hypothetical protein
MSDPQMQDNGPHVDELDKRLHDLSSAFADLGNTADFDELFKIIHNPGRTSWPDIFLVNTLVDAAERAAKDARSVRTALVECVLAISDASVE